MTPIERVTPAERGTQIEQDARFREYAALMDSGRYFEAHEVLEAFWLVAPPAQRDLLQGLVQVAVACEHRRRGNRPGAVKVLARAGSRIEAGAAPAGEARDWSLLLRAARHYIEGGGDSLDFRFSSEGGGASEAKPGTSGRIPPA